MAVRFDPQRVTFGEPHEAKFPLGCAVTLQPGRAGEEPPLSFLLQHTGITAEDRHLRFLWRVGKAVLMELLRPRGRFLFDGVAEWISGLGGHVAFEIGVGPCEIGVVHARKGIVDRRRGRGGRLGEAGAGSQEQ